MCRSQWPRSLKPGINCARLPREAMFVSLPRKVNTMLPRANLARVEPNRSGSLSPRQRDFSVLCSFSWDGLASEGQRRSTAARNRYPALDYEESCDVIPSSPLFCRLLLAAFLFGPLFNPEDWGSSSYETFVNFCRTTRRYISNDISPPEKFFFSSYLLQKLRVLQLIPRTHFSILANS
jgi:hypothetical protein